ncbi:hypothetical protein WJX79_001836 [Trebouxia sp. C0005]
MPAYRASTSQVGFIFARPH